MKKDLILGLLILLHLFFFVSIFAISPISNGNNNVVTTTPSPTTATSNNNATTVPPTPTITPTITPTTTTNKTIDNNTIKPQKENNIVNIKSITANSNTNINIATTTTTTTTKQKNIYVTFADNAQYLKGIIALRMSMIDNECEYGLIVFVTKAVNMVDREPLLLLDCEIREIEMVDIPKEVTVQIDRWRPAFTKFRAWQLTEFDRVIWLDSDMLLLKSLDHLFDLVDTNNPKLLYAAVDADANSCQFKPDRLKLINSGIMVLSPSVDVYDLLINGMIVVSKLPGQINVNDQDVINTTLANWRALEYPNYGVQITHCECEDSRLWSFNSTYFIHFTAGLKELPKPWALLDVETQKANDLFSPMSPCIKQLYLNWIKSYRNALDLIDNNLRLKKK